MPLEIYNSHGKLVAHFAVDILADHAALDGQQVGVHEGSETASDGARDVANLCTSRVDDL